ncbi:MAG: toll/interleukin-1 receptor domain-containing protein, partial [Sphingomonas sp.]|nr:toll/interleukin-1 receptor domain-containing protein [Sphingomonas sp.]
MSDVFISYARSTEPQAKEIADALRSSGYNVWRDDEIPAHKPYAQVIEERLRSSKAVV